jgi:hypothetical protein
MTSTDLFLRYMAARRYMLSRGWKPEPYGQWLRTVRELQPYG